MSDYNTAALRDFEADQNALARWDAHVEACEEAGICPYCVGGIRNSTTCPYCDGYPEAPGVALARELASLSSTPRPERDSRAGDGAETDAE